METQICAFGPRRPCDPTAARGAQKWDNALVGGGTSAMVEGYPKQPVAEYLQMRQPPTGTGCCIRLLS